ncbi:hypothetical protein D3C71_1095160 [compost metagenome]
MRIAVNGGQRFFKCRFFADAPHEAVVAIAPAQKEQQLVGHEGAGEGAQHYIRQVQKMLVRQKAREYHHAFAFQKGAGQHRPQAVINDELM